jgi:trans-2,3-dihydro-3-hydroxyanthranilate isomerase
MNAGASFMKYRIVYLDAFTSQPFCGNPCAVLPEAGSLSAEQMQQVARETNLSETAFVLPSDKADVRVRYFMPHREIPFAGHPTIATAFMLAQEGRGPADRPVSRLDFEFSIGVLPVEVHWDDSGVPVRAVMTQQAPSFGAQVDPAALAESFDLQPDEFLNGLPAQVVGTGVPFLMVPVRTLGALRQARMQRSRLAAALAPLGVAAAYLFCPEGIDADADAHGRLLAPGNAFEDPYTGSAVGALGAFMVRHGQHPGPRIVVEQGHLIGRPGKGAVEIGGSAAGIFSVKVGGCAVRTLEGHIYV